VSLLTHEEIWRCLGRSVVLLASSEFADALESSDQLVEKNTSSQICWYCLIFCQEARASGPLESKTLQNWFSQCRFFHFQCYTLVLETSLVNLTSLLSFQQTRNLLRAAALSINTLKQVETMSIWYSNKCTIHTATLTCTHLAPLRPYQVFVLPSLVRCILLNKMSHRGKYINTCAQRNGQNYATSRPWILSNCRGQLCKNYFHKGTSPVYVHGRCISNLRATFNVSCEQLWISQLSQSTNKQTELIMN